MRWCQGPSLPGQQKGFLLGRPNINCSFVSGSHITSLWKPEPADHIALHVIFYPTTIMAKSIVISNYFNLSTSASCVLIPLLKPAPSSWRCPGCHFPFLALHWAREQPLCYPWVCSGPRALWWHPSINTGSQCLIARVIPRTKSASKWRMWNWAFLPGAGNSTVPP